ncbi:hypothetical protein ACS0TY_031574 [Phlomoides rotata]
MRMMPENLVRCSSLFIFHLLFLQTCNGINQRKNPRNCSTSVCGIIQNISPPFRLKNDPKHCGYRDYELACENNVSFIYLNSQKHQVKAINYHNFTIRLVDVSINNNTCFFPTYSAYPFGLTEPYSYRIPNTSDVAWPINYMSCPYPLKKNSPFLAVTNDCAMASNSVNIRHAYIKAGHMNASEVEDMCRIDLIAMTSWKFDDLKNVSISEIHESLHYGFELSWFRYPCSRCRMRSNCVLRKDHTATCPGESQYVNIPILGFVLGLMYLGKNMILFPCIIGFLIYKFRRRHLSMYDAIEEFLQSDNKLMPIRYSYSHIKKMTRGFEQKLGQGGYGTVYKGKLRSGYDVAVKLLGKPGGKDQDFMSEIATIGRIHHVNIVNLVGYCAEGSKRALVFDFMSNGSLDKYIFDRENMNCLSWERKYEIAVGVARGIEYLHTGCNIQILHFDIKPHNILLDHNFTPKITDFGLAKFYSTDKNMVTMTTARGTIGYVAPELINRGFGGVSFKADVYSFGMLLMEIVGLNQNRKGNSQASSQYFPCWIYDSLEQGQEIEIGFTDENNNDTNKKIIKKMTIVALWCIQMYPGDRPSMNKVVEMLEGQVECLRVPNRPSQSAQVASSIEVQSWSTYSTDSTSLLDHDVAPNVEITVED